MWILFNHKNYKDKDHRQTREVLPKSCFFFFEHGETCEKMAQEWITVLELTSKIWCPGPGICRNTRVDHKNTVNS